MYLHFRDVILQKQINFDTRPLNLVEKLFEKQVGMKLKNSLVSKLKEIFS